MPAPAACPGFIPSRQAALDRLEIFLPLAAAPYAKRRNEDLPGHPFVSGLSPHIRHRLLTESEVITAIRARHPQGADKFLAEVWWRSYWKGWLQMRPQVWAGYRQGLTAARNRLAVESGLARVFDDACHGRTGIDGFDHWARELAETGYLHNHARMWFASIWIFTLRLPWELGADFFLRHLLDGDPASNTLSWRWVAGLHTPGKTYLATAENIERNTAGRFRPKGLADRADAPRFEGHPTPRPAPVGQDWKPTPYSLLLLHDDDLDATPILSSGLRPLAQAALIAARDRSPLAVSDPVWRFTTRAAEDALSRCGGGAVFGTQDLLALAQHCVALGADQVITPFAPTGPVAEALDRLSPLLASHGIPLCRHLTDHDRHAWPHATHGFFRFREAVM